jgi:hypothetical protein
MWYGKRTVSIGAVVGVVLLGGCADYLTGQFAEPPGALQVIKLTLLDSSSRDQLVFTDMSIADCSTAPDCTQPLNQALEICRVCYNEVAKDKFGPSKSVPTPDSGTDLRVVFNKIPKMVAGVELTNESDLTSLIGLTCNSPCVGAPPVLRALNIIGSNLSFDPTFIPYGPSLQLMMDRASDARVSLEPDTTYQVQLSAQLAGRDAVAVQLDEVARKLLTFKTEPFRVLSIGKGDSSDVTTNDTWVYADTSLGTGTDRDPLRVAAIPETGVVALRLNAAVDAALAKSASITATIDGAPVAVSLGVNEYKLDDGGNCVHDDQRTLYVLPSTLDKWPAGKTLNVALPAGVIRDLNQGGSAAFKTGNHSIATPINITTVLQGGGAASDYSGQTIAGARSTSHC